MDTFEIRVFGDPVLKKLAEDVKDIDGNLVKTCDRMLQTMYQAPGIGLAAPQVGISKRFFVYDYGIAEDNESTWICDLFKCFGFHYRSAAEIDTRSCWNTLYLLYKN